LNENEFAEKIQVLRNKLYRTAYLYLGSESDALDAVDEAVYKGLASLKGLRQPEYFGTAETALALNVPQGTAATRLRRALQLLKLELSEEEVLNEPK